MGGQQIMEEQEFYQAFKIDNDISADEGIETLRELQEEIKRLERVTEARIERLKEGFRSKSLPLKEQAMSLENELKAYFSTLKTKDTKTLRKYSLPSGTLVEKKQEPQYKMDNEKLLVWAKATCKDYFHVEEKPCWGEIKKSLEFKEGMAIHKATGEVIKSIEVIEREPKFEIK